MSKKSRKRNRRLLTALAALGGAAMLAGRGKPNMNIPDRGRGELPKGIDKKITDVYPDAIMRGGTGVKPARVFPKLKVDSIGNVIKSGVDTGVGNTKTKFINRNPNMGTGAGIYQGGKKVSDLNPKAINVLSDGSIMAGGVTYPNKEAYANRNKATNPGMSFRDIGNFIFPKANFKDGGKVVKTGDEPKKSKKKTRIQVRGFGKARR